MAEGVEKRLCPRFFILEKKMIDFNFWIFFKWITAISLGTGVVVIVAFCICEVIDHIRSM